MADRVSYLSTEDVSTLWRPLSGEEEARAELLIPMVEDCLRQEAHKAGNDLDDMISSGELLVNTMRAVTLDIVVRILRQSTTGEPMSQESQSALGYAWSGTYAVPAGGVANAILRNDLKRLGIRRQKSRSVDLYETTRDPGDAV